MIRATDSVQNMVTAQWFMSLLLPVAKINTLEKSTIRIYNPSHSNDMEAIYIYPLGYCYHQWLTQVIGSKVMYNTLI